MEYSLEFSKRLIEAAECLKKENLTKGKEDAGRAVLYLSLLSCEISIKAFLEKAGYSVKKLKKDSHSFEKLFKKLCSCEFKRKKLGTAAKLLAKSPSPHPGAKSWTVGKILGFEKTTASKYPNQIRYGKILKHYPAALMLECAVTVNAWAEENFGKFKIKK
jgi:hypothetical protein